MDMDDTHCFSDAPSSDNFDLKGLKTVKVNKKVLEIKNCDLTLCLLLAYAK